MSESIHGTPYTETEILMELVTIYTEWNGDGAPDFSRIQRQLRDDFTADGLTAFDTVVKALGVFIEFELAQRAQEKEQGVQA